MFYVAYYGFNQILGWVRFLRFSPNLPALVIADRYYYDYYYQLGYKNCPKWFVRLIAMFIPKPDMLFVLEREADDIYKKKPELDIGEIRREQAAIKQYLSRDSMTRIIDAGKGVAGTVAQVEVLISDWLSCVSEQWH
jgi:thymidylate kinase